MQTPLLNKAIVILSALSFSACTTAPKESPKAAPVATTASPAVPAAAAADSPVTQTEGVTSKAEATPATAHATPATPATSAHHETPHGTAPNVALKWLKNGNRRFTTSHLRKDGATHKDVTRLSRGQKPHSIVLSCSDSRVPPEIVFDQKLGEIFTVRTAGEALEPSVIASIEYAVEHLGSRNIVVMGHTQCGAVKAALATFGGKDAGSPHLNKLVGDIQPRLKEFVKVPASEGFTAEGWANAKGVAKDLQQRSSILAEKLKSGEIQITPALYHLDAGTVDFAESNR